MRDIESFVEEVDVSLFLLLLLLLLSCGVVWCALCFLFFSWRKGEGRGRRGVTGLSLL